ncbi:hypothetical protein BCT41_15120 [Vibrio splendidus]|uniref:hypothetical protein n=1 Tax=Vibrio splendidus TaxID=29497 RepID=UPI000C8498A9|nr:hypothetical protein [Vibrio splendidus]PMM97284.1 hypothetical protein BCT41_15120 [Vibrio splendidus]
MTTSIPPYTPSQFMNELQTGIVVIQTNSLNCDQFHSQLYFSNVISLMEKYLYDLFIHEITTKDDVFKLMSSAQKFSTQKYPISEIFNGNVKNKVVNAVKNMVWHRLNDIDPLFKHTLNIRMNISRALTDKLAVRHDLIHRNGFDLDGNSVIISNEDLNDCIGLITDFTVDIDTKYHTYLYS